MYKVIIIDDEPWARSVIRQLGNWEQLGLSIAGEAEDGVLGLELIKECRPDIIITDMKMPGPDGAELLRLIQEISPDAQILVMSGYDDFQYMKQAIASRAADYLLKPVKREELHSALERCVAELNRRQQFWGAVFSDANTISRYLAERRYIHERLLELDEEGIVRGFESLFSFLTPLVQEERQEETGEKIQFDYHTLLEEFFVTEELSRDGIRPLLSASGGGGHRTLAGLSGSLTGLYTKAVQEARRLRAAGGSLDIEEVAAFLSRQFASPVSLETTAKQFLVSKEYLSRAFKQHTGKTVSDFITELRMEKAKELLIGKRTSIKHTAELCGYADLGYFYKVFKKYFRSTPGDMRGGEE